MAVVNELVTKFSFAGSITPLLKFNTALGGSIKSVGIAYGAMLGLSAAVGKFTLATTSALDPMLQLSRTTGVSVSRMQELGYAASVSGSSLQAVQGTISTLSEKIGDAAWRGNEEFARLGISVRGANGDLKTADTVLSEIQNRFRSIDLSKQEQMSFAGRLGIDKSLVQLMRKSGSEIDALTSKARKLGVLTAGEASAAISLNDAMTTLKFGLSAVQNQIAVGIAPHMQRFADLTADLLGGNRSIISTGVGHAIDLFVSFGGAIKDLFPIMAIGAGLMLAIWAPIPLLGAGILLFIQDLMVAFRGGNSVIRSFVKEWTGLDITPGMRAIVDWFKSEFKPVLDEIVIIFKWLFENNPLARLAGAAGALAGGNTGGAIESLDRGWLGTATDYWKGAIFGGGAQSTTNSSSVVNNTNNIEIRSTERSEDLARAIKSQIIDAEDQSSRGGR